MELFLMLDLVRRRPFWPGLEDGTAEVLLADSGTPAPASGLGLNITQARYSNDGSSIFDASGNHIATFSPFGGATMITYGSQHTPIASYQTTSTGAFLKGTDGSFAEVKSAGNVDIITKLGSPPVVVSHHAAGSIEYMNGRPKRAVSAVFGQFFNIVDY